MPLRSGHPDVVIADVLMLLHHRRVVASGHRRRGRDGLATYVNPRLTKAGYQVLAAANGEEALTTAERHPAAIHAVLTDVVMPGMNGRELADALRFTRPQTPVWCSCPASPIR